MLNMKKGLAIVLAAATAFTFAPVANLGVTAKAASTDAITSLTIPSAAFTGADVSYGAFTNQPIADGVSKTYALVSGKGFYLDDVIIKAQKDHTYELEATDGTYVYKKDHKQTDGSSDPKDTDALALKTAITDKDSNGNLEVDIWVPSAGSHTITFSDRTSTGAASGTVKSISFTIKSEKDASNITGLDIYKAKSKSFTSSTADYEKDATTGSMKNNDGIYALSMNDNADGYFVDGLSSATVTAWNGMSISGTTNEVSDSSTTLKVVDGTKYGSSATDSKVADTSYVRLIPTAPTNGTLNLKVTAKKSADTVATVYLPFAVDKSANAIDTLSFTDNFKHTSYVSKDGAAAGYGKLAKDSAAQYTLTGLDKQVHNAGQFTVKAESGDVSYKSEDSKIVAVDENGKVTVNGVGTTKVYIFVGSTQNNKALTAVVTMKVADWADDELTVDTTNGTDLDVSTQTAENKVLNTTLKVTSAGGLKTKIEQDAASKDFFTVDTNTGVITSKDKAGVGYVTVTSVTDTAKAISGTTKSVKITVWTLPAAVFTVPDVTVEAGKSTLLTANVAKPNPYSIVWNNSDASTLYTLSNAEQTGILNNNTQTTSRLTAGSAVGTAKIYATVLGTNTTRPTTKTATVTVLNKALTNHITLDDASKALVLKEGETAQLKGTASVAGKTVTFQGGDAAVATVTTAGAVTAVKAGTTTIKAVSDGADSIEIPVVVVATQKAPAAVTGVKVANKKGAYVSVKWASQDKNINYRVYKKVGNGSWKAKNVAGNKTTLSVKKGAKVTVKVKAYVKDANGNTTWGPKATKKTFKTDKK